MDSCVIQLGSQSHVHRLAEYATNPALQVFPRDPQGRPVCTEAQELGPRHSDHIGPCLLLLRHCVLSPALLARTVESSFLRRYVHRVYWCNEEASTEASAIARAVSILEGLEGGPCLDGAEAIRQGHPQALDEDVAVKATSHPPPSSSVAPPAKQDEAATPLQANAEHEGPVRVRVQAFPRSSEDWVTQQIPVHIGLHPKHFTHTLNFVVAAAFCPAPSLQPSLRGPCCTRRQAAAFSAQVDHPENTSDSSPSRIGARLPAHSNNGSQDEHRAAEGTAACASGPAPDRAPSVISAADVACTGSGGAVAGSVHPASRHEREARRAAPAREAGAAVRDGAGREQGQVRARGRASAGAWQKMVLFGVSRGEDMWRLPSDRAGLATGCASSAVCKLEEVLDVLAWHLDAGSSVIDVGAAPGAWTVLLSHRAGRVLAIDPAPLSAAALSLPNVTHVQSKVEEAASQVLRWLQPENGDNCNQPSSFKPGSDDEEGCDDRRKSQQRPAACDAVFCDANKHPAQSAELVLPLLPFLKPGALIVITMKCRGRGRSKEALAAELTTLLGNGIERTQCLWLMANSVFERTFVAFKS